jgi:hypothetical protein
MQSPVFIENQISSIEERWLDALWDQCRSHFQAVHLPSHDHFHHYRVWFYAKKLILTLSGRGINFTHQLIEEIIFAVLFHDVGMSVTRDENHGKVSADLFRDFISERSDQTESNHDEIYKAIAHHDQKNYVNVPFKKAFATNNILSTVLNISDDLDAFGYIGVYRYLEIYLLRNMEPELLAGKVLPNLKRRFSNISFTLGKIASFVNIHQVRYQHTLDFFNDLNTTGYIPDGPLTGPAGIVKMIREHVIANKGNMNNLIESKDIAKNDEYIRNFLHQYQFEEDNFKTIYPGF